MKRFALSLVIFLTLLALLNGCSDDVETNKVYALSPSTAEMHVFNARSLSPILTEPLLFSGVGIPEKMRLNREFHQILVTLENSNQLVRIGTEAPFPYTSLPYTTYGDASDFIVDALPNPPQDINVLLTSSKLLGIDEFAVVVAAQVTPSPTASTSTPTPTPTPTPLPLATGGFTASIDLPFFCNPVGLALNMVAEVGGEENETLTTEDDASDDDSGGNGIIINDDDDDEEDSDLFVSGGIDVRFKGGDQAIVICAGTDEAALYQIPDFSLIATVSLTPGFKPQDVLFVRTPEEKGDTVTGVYGIWNDTNTLELISSTSHSRLTGSPFLTTPVGNTRSTFGANLESGYFLTGSGGAVGGRIDVRDFNGNPVFNSPLTLLSDCDATGPSGINSEILDFDVSQREVNDGAFAEDLLIYYTCPQTGVVGGLSGNLGITYLMRTLGAGTEPGIISKHVEKDYIYVALNGTTAPAPGIIALDKFNLTDAFYPPSITFSQGATSDMIVVP